MFDKVDLLKELAEVLGFDLIREAFKDEDYPVEVLEVAAKFINQKFSNSGEAVDKLLSLRDEARNNKDWNLADNIRSELKNIGLEIEDTPMGARLKVLSKK